MSSPPPSLQTANSRELLDQFKGGGRSEICLGLDRIRTILGRVGNPHLALPPTVHVAGTNGKGSVLAYLRSFLAAAGYTVHSFNSPHLVTVHDGILLDGLPVSEANLAGALSTIANADTDHLLTPFEALTGAAFVLMAQEPADFVLLETGLGGKEDATNVIERPIATVLTPIDLDHQEFLGDTLSDIASQKLGILKQGAPAIVGPQQTEIADLIERFAEALPAPAMIYNRDWSVFEQHGRLVFQDEKGLLDLDLPYLQGRFQIENAGTAIATLRTALPHIGDDLDIIERGLANVQWLGRLHRLSRGPLIDHLADPAELWVDGGHNAHAARALSQALADMDERAPLPTHLIIGMRKNKDLSGFLNPFVDLVRSIQAVALPEPTLGYAPEEIAQFGLKKGFGVEIASSIEKAVENLTKDAAQPKRILVCGSLLLAGQLLESHS